LPETNRPSGSAARPPVRAARAWLGAILALSFAVRVVYVLQSRRSPAFEQPAMDALYHLEWARAFAAGHEFQPGPFFRAPLYPWFLGLLLRLFGEHLSLVRLVQAAVGTASVGLVYLVGARAFDARTGLLAALLSGLTWITIYFECDLLLPVLEIFFDLLAIWLALRAGERTSPARAALAGAALGVAALVRPNVLLFAPFLLVWTLARARATGRGRALLPALLFALALLAPIAPVTAYNRIAGGDWVLISSQGGVNFWIGNNPRSDGSSAIVPGTRADWWGGYHDSIRLAEAEEGRKLRPSEVSRHYSAKAWAWIRSEPRAALAHLVWKLRLFWVDWELSNDASERFFAFRFGPVLRWLPFGFGALAPLALLGFLLASRRSWSLLPLWGFLPVYTASVVAFFVCSRFRVPVLPVLAVFAAHACWRLVDLARARARLPLAGSAAFLAGAVFLVESVPAAIDRSDGQGLWQLGIAAARRGDDAGAVDLFRASVAASGRSSQVHADLGDSLRRLGRLEDAERSLRRAVELAPRNPAALASLFDLLLASGRRTEAREVARAEVEAAPVLAQAWYDLGRLDYDEARAAAQAGTDAQSVRKRDEAALTELEKGLELASEPATAFRCAFAAGKVRLELGDPAAAADAFARALEAQPQRPAGGRGLEAAWWWQCQAELLRALEASGRSAEAQSRRLELERRYPDDPRSRGR
jgi:4-amino-4-deoxy-L-arabinose transferase-like glycosyltransferase